AVALVIAAFAGCLAATPLAGADPLVPNDPAWPEQWAQRIIRMPDLWQFTTGDPRIVIAQIDSGADRSGPDVQGAFAPGWDFVDDDADPQDTDGHGTIVAAQVAARGNNGIGVAGYCW